MIGSGDREAAALACQFDAEMGTLARDLKDFAALGWQPTEVTPYDMFPHTPHIESVTRLEYPGG